MAKIRRVDDSSNSSSTPRQPTYADSPEIEFPKEGSGNGWRRNREYYGVEVGIILRSATSSSERPRTPALKSASNAFGGVLNGTTGHRPPYKEEVPTSTSPK